jgi:uncharacterized protein (DUF2249 family)
MISCDVTLDRLLERHPGLVDVLAGIHPHFQRLRNPLLRRLIAPRTTVAEAAAMAGMSPGDLLVLIRRAAGEEGPESCGHVPAPEADRARPRAPRPDELDRLRPVLVDVRDDIRRGLEPFARIMEAARALGEDEALVLRAPFEPVPLYGVLGRRGFAHWSERLAEADWAVWFFRSSAAAAPGRAHGEAGGPAARAVTVDVRGLEPPQPMLRVLERLDALEPDQELVVVHDRRPMFLYPQLDDRGFVHETRDVGPGHVEIRIRRAPAS